RRRLPRRRRREGRAAPRAGGPGRRDQRLHAGALRNRGVADERDRGGRPMIPTAAAAALPWRNPVLVRFCRSRLRLRKSVFWFLLTLIITTFVVTLTYIVRTKGGTPAEDAARGLWIPLLIIQGLILMFKGTGSVAAGLIQDKIDQTLDYQRLTPVAPLRRPPGAHLVLPVPDCSMCASAPPPVACTTADITSSSTGRPKRYPSRLRNGATGVSLW